MLFRDASIALFGVIVVVKAQQPKDQLSLDEPVVCDCGFIDEDNNVWSDVWYADYGTYRSNLHYDRNYVVMDYTVNAKHKNTLDRVFARNNVRLSQTDGITLSVQKDANGKYTSAAVGTKRSDFLYGTYRARMKTSNVDGTVAAFFMYRNDTSEIDMESLSRIKDPFKTYFAIQPQIYNNDGSASPLTNEKHDLDFNPTEDYHEYRFDWLPGSVKFYIDSIFVREMTTNVPNSPGRILLNHWTDGNPYFSGGPPTENADLRVSHLNMFFNSSESKQPPSCSKSEIPCSISDIMSRNLLPESAISSMSRMSIPTFNSAISMIIFCLIFYFYH